MKKFAVLLMTAVMLTALTGCGGKNDASNGDGSGESKYAEAIEILDAVFGVYEEADKFAVYGGNQENPVMDAPGKFDITKTDELTYVLGLPEAMASNIDDAASMVHMMNGNVFTGAVYRLKDGVDMNDFAEEVRTNILATQWMCGQPDTLVIIKVDGSYVITAYGAAETIETFKNNALSTLEGSEVIIEAPIE